MDAPRLGLVTGATGYVGRLVALRLLDEGWRVRVVARNPKKLDPALRDRVDVVQGDAGDPSTMDRAMADVNVAWFLLHSMGSDDFSARDRHFADVFARAAREHGVQRIVYLGGLHPDEGDLSEHLASRVEVGQILLDSGVPTAALQAGVLLGPGSASFEMLAALSERLPAALSPRWVGNRISPIFVDEALHYLVRAADLDPSINRTFDIGGRDSLRYVDMMKRYRDALGMPRMPVAIAPVATPGLAGHWMGFITPIQTKLATPLVQSVQSDTIVKERDLDDLVGPPPGGPLSFDDAIREASADRDVLRPVKVLSATSAAVLAALVLGAVATTPSVGWYKSLRLPRWQPPTRLFGPVWTALYADIAAVTALKITDLLQEADADPSGPAPAELRRFLSAAGFNLTLNASWSWVFWRARKLDAATIVAAALAASSADLVRRVSGHRERGLALAPYAGWTAFATVLTGTIAALNRRR